MVHPLNELKQAKAARNELSKVRKATAGVVTREDLEDLRAEILDELAAALAPIRGALEIDELDQAIDELPDPETVGDPDAGEDA